MPVKLSFIKPYLKSNGGLILFIILLYALRLFYCYEGYLKNYMWLDITDESHIYLLGLKYFITGQYPYWGPDITYTATFLTGGLQGLLTGLPLYVWHHPFAPYLFLFLISSAALLYLSWYITKVFPALQSWVIYGMIAIAPFAVHTGLKIINPAYVLCFSIPFFLSFMETLHILPTEYIGLKWRFFWMGLGVSAVFQLNASWVVLFIMLMVAAAWAISQLTWKQIIRTALCCCAGLILGALSLLPTIYQFGWHVLFIQAKNLDFSISHITDVFNIIYYIFVLAGFEMNTFSRVYTWGSLIEHASIISGLIFVIIQITGYVLFAAQIIALFLKKWKPYTLEYRKLFLLTSSIIISLWFIFLFSFVRPGMHAIICFFPLSAILICWFLNRLIRNREGGYKFIAVFIFLNMAYYGIIIHVDRKLPDLGYRSKAFEAIAKKDAGIFETSRYTYPVKKNNGPD
jgi:hypothetical protein